MDRRTPWALYVLSLDIENSLSEQCVELWPRLGKWFSKQPSTKVFLLAKIPELVYRIATALIAARWPYRLPVKNLTVHYNSQFCVSFHFCFAQEA